MKILLLTYDFYPNVGGVAYVLHNVVKQLKARGHEVIVINPFFEDKKIFKLLTLVNTRSKRILSSFFNSKYQYFAFYSFWVILKDKKVPFSERLQMIAYLLLNPKKFKWTLENLIRIYPLIKKLEFDFIFGGNSRWILPLNYIISRIFNKKIITMAYGSDFLLGWPLEFKSLFYKNLDGIAVISEKMKHIFMRTHNLNEIKDRINVVRVGINVKDLQVDKSKEEIRMELEIQKDSFILLSVGRHNPRKNFHLVIRALSNIRKKIPDINIKYYLIGEGEVTDYLKNLTKELNLENIVTFLGSCDLKTRNRYYKSADVFLMPSTTEDKNIEGFGIVFLEANIHNVPVIGTYHGGVRDAIIDKQTGLFSKPNDIDDLVKQILFFYNNEDERRKMGQYGSRRVTESFIWEKIISDYTSLFNQIYKK